MKYLFILPLLLLISCTQLPKNKPPVKLYKTHDLVTNFIKGWEKIKSSPETEWKDYWWDYFLANKILFLDITNCNNDKYRDLAIKLFKSTLNQRYKKLPQIVSDAKKNYPLLESHLSDALTILNKKIPIRKPIDVYYVMYIHPFEGKEFFYGDIPAFAMDLSFPYAKNTDYKLIFIHECFHVLHFREVGKSLENDPVGLIMREGLAVYATKIILPGSPDSRYTFLTTEEIRKCKLKQKEIIEAMLKYTNNYDMMNKLFFSSGQNLKWPPRCGYYIALKVMENLSKKYSLKELYKLPPKQYKKEVIGSLQKLLNQNIPKVF